MAGVIWRQHRYALLGVVALLGALALYLGVAGASMHHAYATALACRPASSYACQNQVIDFNTAYAPTAQTVGILLMAVPMLIGAFVGAPVLAGNWKPAPSGTPGPRASDGGAGHWPSWCRSRSW